MQSEDHGDAEFMRSLARGMHVLQALCDARQPQSIAMLSARTGLSRAAVRRCLYTLRQLGYVVGELHAHTPAPQIRALGHAYRSSTPLALKAQPLLDKLGQALQQACSVAVLNEDDIICVANTNTSRAVSMSLSAGSCLPAYCSALGRVMLAHLPAAQLDSYLGRTSLAAMTGQTVVSPTALREVLAEVRRCGHALNDEELEIGLRAIAVPVWSAACDEVVAALNVAVQASQVSVDQLHRRFLPALRETARELSALL
ncbi:IclR family transcriptional regulator domain-containing protein [Duganella radicis]|uniref:Helix-turn-helix domain-containing protein n=1 Tax=Duganella radicis TaxID=551988 RepID=A0A6L6PE48_9BURK|nr:IclR family transcriptional regulator C-terminal domain-containing protein [Duganella radicis]MTV36989.1 helix-turn-helix domain-containing protein [Duganella radicis]